MKINHFHAHLRGFALESFKNIERTPTTMLEDILVVYRRKYVKPESSASAKHRFHRLVFDHCLVLETTGFPRVTTRKRRKGLW